METSFIKKWKKLKIKNKNKKTSQCSIISFILSSYQINFWEIWTSYFKTLNNTILTEDHIPFPPFISLYLFVF